MVIDESGRQLGHMSPHEGRRLAEERGLDLVEVAPGARPPVCRIMDYGKFKYEQKKKEADEANEILQLRSMGIRALIAKSPELGGSRGSPPKPL